MFSTQKHGIPIQPRQDSDVESDLSSEERQNAVGDSDDSAADSSVTSTDREQSDEESQEEDNDALQDISFGALAKAQESIQQVSRKRKRLPAGGKDDGDAEDQTLPDYSKGAEERSKSKSEARDFSRSSKHAPAMQSSKNPVSRRRVVFSPPPSMKSRDPRFDATIKADVSRQIHTSGTAANKNYSFLSDYQASEVLDLKSSLKNAKDPAQQAELKKQIMSLEARLRNAQRQSREAEILRQHRQQEKAAIREGKKSRPYYLKKSDLRKQLQNERLESMGKRARDKSEMRQRKRQKVKEARTMPRARRTIDQQG